jgi:hypothetical protein
MKAIDRACPSVESYFEDHKESGALGRLALRGAKPHDVAAPGLIGRDSTATAADPRWCGDITDAKTWDGCAYMYVLWNPSCMNLHVRNGFYLRGSTERAFCGVRRRSIPQNGHRHRPAFAQGSRLGGRRSHAHRGRGRTRIGCVACDHVKRPDRSQPDDVTASCVACSARVKSPSD